MPEGRSLRMLAAARGRVGNIGLLALSGLAVWVPPAIWLGSGMPVAQFVWAIWCGLCALALSRVLVRREAPDDSPVKAVPAAGGDDLREQDVLQGIPLAACVCALPDGEIVFVNGAMAELAGEPAQALIGRSPADFCMQDEQRGLFPGLLQDAGGFQNVEVPARRLDGDVRWLSVSGRASVFSGRPAFVFVCHDITRHKQAQRSLAASEERFRVLLGALSEAVVLYDAEGRVLTRNRAAESCSWLAEAHAGLPGGRYGARLCDEHGRALPAEMHPVIRALAEGVPARDIVIGSEDADGRMRWLEVNTQPLFHTGARRAYAVVASYSDLTARIRAERALRASEQRYALALRGMNEGLAEWITGSDSLYVSPRLSQILGFEAGGRRMRVRDFISMVHPDDKPSWMATIVEHLRGRSDHFQVELRILHADGTFHWFMLRGVAQRDASGRSKRLVATMADISVSKRLERVDAAERELLSLIATAMPLRNVTSRLAELAEGLLDADARAAVFVFNESEGEHPDVDAPNMSSAFRSGAAAFAMRPGIGGTFDTLHRLHPVLCEDVMAIDTFGIYRAFLTAEGLRAVWALPLAGQGGTVLGSLTIYHPHAWRPGRTEEMLIERLVDIAQLALERARGERQVRELNASLEHRVAERTKMLEQANNELEAFSYSVSHDLRSPLRAINGFAHLLAEHAEAALDAEGRDMLVRIQRGATRMGQLIDDILHFSRMARVDLAHSEVNLDALVASVVAELSEQYPAARVSVSDIGHACGDLAMLRQVFVNLIGNALKFSAHAEQAEVSVFVDTEGKPAICVRDNGVGFDLAYADRLFGVFQRGHGSDAFPGTGVGLAIVKRIVERHGGAISVQAAPGQGATFRFTLGHFMPSDRVPSHTRLPRTGT
jgi:PAS domain S-box-containing protein